LNSARTARFTDGTRLEARRLMALVAVAVAVRVAAVFAVGSYRLDRVTYEHGEIARNLVEGRGFSIRWMGAEGPTSQQAPVYPALVAVFYCAFGVETASALLALQLFQAALGGVLVVAVTQFCRELMPEQRATAWLAGLGCAVYPILVYAVTQVQVASLATLLVVFVLWTAARAARCRSLATAVGCGTASGLLVLADPILSLAVAVALLMIVAARTPILCTGQPGAGIEDPHHSSIASHHSPIHLCTIVLIVSATVVASWIVRNRFVHGEWVFVKSTFGYAFWQGNHARSFGTDKIPARPAGMADATAQPLRELERSLWQARHEGTLYIDDVVLSRQRVAELGRYSEPERSRRLFAESLAYLREHPAHYARLCLQRLRFFVLFDETNPKSRVRAYRVSHWTLLVMCVAGLWLTRQHTRRLWPTYLLFALVTTFHALTIASARFHIPLEPIRIIWAAGGLAAAASVVVRLARRVVSSRSLTRPNRVNPLASPAKPV